MHNIVIKGLIGIDYAEFDVNGVALLAGINRVGKTTIAQGIGAALTGVSAIRGVKTKAGSGVLVRGGSSSAEVIVSSAGGQSSMTWPACEYKTDGDRPPKASVLAVGLIRFAELDERDRAELLIRSMKALPSREDWIKHMAAAGIAETVTIDGETKPGPAAAIWNLIERNGWDATHASRVKAGQTFKAQWEATTNTRYGSKIGADWKPDGWHTDLETSSLQTLGAAIAEAQEGLEAEVAKGAVAGDRVARLRDTAQRLEGLRKLHEAAIAASDAAEAEAEVARKAIEGLQPIPPAAHPCPHCNKGVAVVLDLAGGIVALEQAVIHDAATVEILKENHRKAKQQHDAAIHAADKAQAEVDRLEDAIDKAKIAAEELAVAEKAQADVNLEGAREKVRIATLRKEMFEAWTKAAGLHRSISANQYAIDALAPEGLRATKLKDSVARFNKALTEIGEAWELPNLHLNEHTFEPQIGGRAYGVMAESEQWAVDSILQFAFASLDGSPMVIIDRIDVLATELKKQVFRWIAQSSKRLGFDVVVCGTWAERSKAPVLDKSGLGNSYWVSNGTVRRMAASEAA